MPPPVRTAARRGWCLFGGRYPPVGGTGAGWNLRRGFPPGPGRGIQDFSRESLDAKSRGGWPPAPPSFMARSLALARFGVVGRSEAVVGLFRNPCTCPDLETFFRKMLFEHISRKNASQIGFRIPEGIAPRTDQRQRSPKRASDSKRTIKAGVQGRSPGPLSPHFSGEMGTPAGQAGPPGRCAPRVLSRHPPLGYAAPSQARDRAPYDRGHCRPVWSMV